MNADRTSWFAPVAPAAPAVPGTDHTLLLHDVRLDRLGPAEALDGAAVDNLVAHTERVGPRPRGS